MGIKVCANHRSILGPRKRLQYGKFEYLNTIPLTMHRAKCIDIWYEATGGQGDKCTACVQIMFLGL